MNPNEHFKEDNEMADDDLEREIEEDVTELAKHEANLPEGIQKGSGEEEYQHLLKKDPEFAMFLDRFPDIIEAFGELAMSEVLKGKIRENPARFELLKKLFVFFKRNEFLIEYVAKDISEKLKIKSTT